MAMVSTGATPGSKNALELEKLLRLPITSQDCSQSMQILMQQLKSDDPKVNVLVANSQWSRSSILESYKERIGREYAAEAFDLPASPQPINAWVKAKTNSLIPEVLSNIDPLVVSILINAVYFKGEWTNRFDAEHTVEAPFHVSPTVQLPVQMMMRKDKKMLYAEVSAGDKESRAQVVELPYGEGEQFSAVVVLPSLSDADGMSLTSMMDALAAKPALWEQWMMQLRPTDVRLGLPRFKVEYGMKDLKEALSLMGVTDAFTGTPDGAFLAMSDDPQVYLSAVLHKTVVEVNEEGTEAAAVTAAIMKTRSLPRPPLQMLVDRPFIFAIRSRVSGALLFMCRINNPTAG
ncbi:hypothetical protein CYMTET_6864 [Cymbomonas tetramitiformis]|uniref:Serpin domain-containing protein n=1 Tax=Cymbomonas tetramitiformis TaxID=36881 RepID=A0AAE0GWK7_9CHLO|nr:hypothetical protein CYMTET_6864 [Cymbomonas tetramitiformis]